MKPVRYSRAALTSLRRHANVAPRIREALIDYAAGTGGRGNQVKALRGGAGLRLRVGDFRVIFIETESGIDVIEIGPRGKIYD
jgi:mRNA interferase RelE/StbE